MRRPFAVTVAAALAIAAGAVTGVAVTDDAQASVPAATTKYASGMPWSDGGFFEHSAAQAEAFAQWRGAPVDNIVAYTSRATWKDQLNDWWADTVPDTFDPKRDDFILSVPLWTDDGMAGGDQGWKQLGRQIAAVDPNAWCAWLGDELLLLPRHRRQKWRKQFSRAVTLMRSTAPGLQIVFNPNEGGAQNGTVPAIESLYVKGKVDVIALDAYDWWKPFTTQANISSHFTKKYGWDYWYKFARDRDLPFALAEFSVSSASDASGGDNPKFFDATYNWLWRKQQADPGSIRFVALFNESARYCECALSSAENPQAARKYKALIAKIRTP